MEENSSVSEHILRMSGYYNHLTQLGVNLPFDIPFLRNTEIGKKTAIWAGPPVNRLVPKII